MQWLRQLISYAITIGIILALVLIVPRFARLRVDASYNDIDHLEPENSLNADTGVAFGSLAVGDGVAFRLGTGEGLELCLGWVAALPGDEVSMHGGQLLVNGKKSGFGGDVDMNLVSTPVMVPAGHCFVVSTYHRMDSVSYGPIPAASIRARLSSLP